MHVVIEVWVSALKRSNPAYPAMKTKQENKSWFRFFFFQWNLFLVGNSNLSNKNFPVWFGISFYSETFNSFFSFPPKFHSLPWPGISIFLWERKTLSFGGLLATIFTHCLTVLRGTDLQLYSICSARSSFCFPVSRALLCVSSIIVNTPFLLLSDSKAKHVEESDDANIFMLRGFDQWW